MYEKLQEFDEENQSMLSSFMKENEALKKENEHLKKENHEMHLEQHSLNAKVLELTYNNEIFTAELKREKEKAEENFEYYKKNIDIEHLLALRERENELKDLHKEELDKIRTELDKYKELYYSNITGKQD